MSKKLFRISSYVIVACATMTSCSESGNTGVPGPIGSVVTIAPVPTPQQTPPAVVVPVSPTASPMPTPSTTPVGTTITGKVVDFNTDVALAGIVVGIRSYGSAGAYTTVATTSPDGSFEVPTTYQITDIEIGSESPKDIVRATEHDIVNAYPGRVQIIPQEARMGVANTTTVPAQTTGVSRLATLTSNEESCLTAVNSARDTAGLPELVEDEYQLETTRAIVSEETAQQTDQPVPLVSAPQIYEGNTQRTSFFEHDYFSSCQAFVNVFEFGPGSPAYDAAINPATNWYAGNYDGSGTTPYMAESFASSVGY